jgi:hypothetical protein
MAEMMIEAMLLSCSFQMSVKHHSVAECKETMLRCYSALKLVRPYAVGKPHTNHPLGLTRTSCAGQPVYR